jgi:ankyrin repeat protein
MSEHRFEEEFIEQEYDSNTYKNFSTMIASANCSNNEMYSKNIGQMVGLRAAEDLCNQITYDTFKNFQQPNYNYKGEWKPNVLYSPNDVIIYNDSRYLANKMTINDYFDTNNFDLFAGNNTKTHGVDKLKELLGFSKNPKTRQMSTYMMPTTIDQTINIHKRKYNDDGDVTDDESFDSPDNYENESTKKICSDAHDYYSLLISSILNKSESSALHILRNEKVDLSRLDGKGNPPLFLACMMGLVNVALQILDMDNFLPDHIAVSGNTALILSLKLRSMKPVSLRLIRGCTTSLNSKSKSGNTALMYAIREYQPDLALELINRGINLDIQNIYLNTAYIFACKYGFSDIVSKLEASGCNTSIKNKYGLSGNYYIDIYSRRKRVKSPYVELYNAILLKKTNHALYLLETEKIDLTKLDSAGNTLLIRACRAMLPNVANKILDIGDCLPDHVAKDNITALYWCISLKKMDPVTVRLIRGCKLETIKLEITLPTTNMETSILQFACIKDRYDIVMEILNRQIPIIYGTNDWSYIKEFAVKHNIQNIVEPLVIMSGQAVTA